LHNFARGSKAEEQGTPPAGHQGGRAAVMPFLKPLGAGIILICALSGCNPLDEERTAERRPRRQQQRHLRTREVQPRQLQDTLLLQPQDPRPPGQQTGEGEEDGPRDQPRLLGGPEVVIGTGAVWSKLVTACFPAQRDRCLSPPCAEV